MGLDTSATLFYGITDGEEDHEARQADEWFEQHGLEPLPGIELDFAGSHAYIVPYLFSKRTRQGADGDLSTVIKLEPWPPNPPPDGHIAWLAQAAATLGWDSPDWHLAVLLMKG